MLRLSIHIVKNTYKLKDLLSKDKRKIFKRFTFIQKSILFMYILFPSLARVYYKIYRVLNGVREELKKVYCLGILHLKNSFT
jgi:hypothetical protein